MTGHEQSDMFIRTEEEVTAIRKAFGLTESSIREGVDSLIEWFEKQPHLVKAGTSRVFLEIMIIIAKGSLERAKEKINNFYRCRFYMPEFIQNREEILHSSDKIWDSYSVVPMPKLLDNRRVFINQFGTEGYKFDLVEFFKRMCMLLDLRLKYDYILGDIWILDMEHVGWAQVLAQNPLVFRKILQLFTKALNWRIYGIHVINAAAPAAIVQRILDFFKQFVTSQIMDRVVIHDSLDDLYKYVPKECLPEDYGGKGLSMEKLKEISETEYRKPETMKYLLEFSKALSDESLRPRDKDSLDDFLAGSFRKLEVD